jgi:hypothetical protein
MRILTRISKVICIAVLILLMFATIFPANGTAASRLEMGKKVLKSGPIELTYNNIIPGKEQIVFLIGENHASVEVQIQLSSLLVELYKAKAIDVILIEGANGSVEVEPFVKQIAKESSMPDKDIRKFWRRQLHWGKISGFEYFALLYPRIEIFGVEDMREKEKYTAKISAFSRENFNFRMESNRRGVKLIEEAITYLKGTASGKELAQSKKVLEWLKYSISNYEKVLNEIFLQYTPIAKLNQEQIEARVKYISIYNKLEKPLENALEWEKTYKKLLNRYKSQQRHSSEEQLTMKLLQLKTKLENFNREYGTDLENLGSLKKQYKQNDKKMTQLYKNYEPYTRKLTEARAKVEDHFFITFNLITAIGDSYARDFRKIKTFFADESDRLEELYLTRDRRKELLPRDRAMIQNSVDYLKNTRKKSAVLIVGYAHLQGIAAQLKLRKISFLGGKLKACHKDTEPWEVAAWKERKKRNFDIFSQGDKLKEKTLLLNEQWKKDQVKMQGYFRDYRLGIVGKNLLVTGLAGGSRIFKLDGVKDRSIRIGKLPLDLNAEVGEHIVVRGLVPFNKDVSFEVVDRGIAKNLVEKNSDGLTSFVFYRKERGQNGKTAYKITTSGGEQSLEDFLKAPPQTPGKGSPKRVVVFGETDEVHEGILAISPFWRHIRQGGGSGNLPPTGPSKKFSSGEPGDRWTALWFIAGAKRKTRHPALYRTINPRRAKENLNRLDMQDPANFGDPLFLEEKDLPQLTEKLKLTPRKGDYAQMVIIIARNIKEFRDAIKNASKNRRLKNKQVALIMCGDLFVETAELRETLLREGALMVWHPDRQISPEAAKRLKQEIKTLLDTINPMKRPQTIDELIYKALERWMKKEPYSPDPKSFDLSSTYVINIKRQLIRFYNSLG